MKYNTHITYTRIYLQVHRCALNRWPDHGTIDCETSDITFGSTCSVRCHLGYILPVSDSSSIKCGKWGIWTPPSPPNCKRKNNSVPHTPTSYRLFLCFMIISNWIYIKISFTAILIVLIFSFARFQSKLQYICYMLTNNASRMYPFSLGYIVVLINFIDNS